LGYFGLSVWLALAWQRNPERDWQIVAGVSRGRRGRDLRYGGPRIAQHPEGVPETQQTMMGSVYHSLHFHVVFSAKKKLKGLLARYGVAYDPLYLK
jgi:hypothetical protein